MQTTSLGRTNLKISRFCLGTMTWGNGQLGDREEQNAHAQMDYALGQGINFWDTAEAYAIPQNPATCGATESLIGTWFKKTGRRSNVILASKVSPGRAHIRGGAGISPQSIEQAIEGSLKRLQTDYIDLYQFHGPNPRSYPHHQNHWDFQSATNAAPHIENMHASLDMVASLIKAGKIRTWGLSNDSAWGIMTYQRLAEKFSLPQVASVQNEFSLIYRWDEPYMSEICTLENIAFLPYSPLGMGILTGKYQGGKRPEGSRIHLKGNSTVHRFNSTTEAATAAYIKIAEKAGTTPTKLALAWTLTRPFVTSTILGATTLEQLKECIAAESVKLTPETLSQIEQVRRQYPIPF